jgi:competence protein ComEC
VSSGVALGVGAVVGALTLEVVGAVPLLLGGVALVLVRIASAQATSGGAMSSRLRLMAVAVGLIAIGLRALVTPAASTEPVQLPEGNGPWTAAVVSVGSPKAGTRPAVIRLDAPIGITIAATLPWYPEVVPGDRIETTGAIQPPPATDYAAYLERVGAAGTLRAGSLTVLPTAPGFGQWLEGLRRSAASALDRTIPEPEAGLAAGILIGLRDRVDRDLAAAFTTAGASHVVAISGWNIAIVATTLGALAGGIGRRRRSVLTGVAIALYVLFVGPSPSVLRAGAMAGIALAARELGRPSRAAAAMGLAVAILLVLNPASVDDPGFRLSVLATAGLMAWGTPLARRLSGPTPGRARAWLAESLGVSLAAQAATTPVILLEFGRLSLVAPFVNLGVVPLVAPAMAAGGLALVAGVLAGLGFPGAVATIGGLPAWVLLGAIVAMIRAGASVPLASVTLSAPWDVVAALVSGVAILLIARFGGRLRRSGRSRQNPPRPAGVVAPAVAGGRERAAKKSNARATRSNQRGRRVGLIALAGATIALALAVSHRPDGSTRVVVLDVGQGDAILVEGSRGGRMVVDGGPDPGRLLIALDERLPAWDHRIDTLVLTHPHEDHAAGLAVLLSRYRIGRIYEPGMIGPGPGYAAMAALLAHGGPQHGTLSTGDRLTLDDIRFRVLWPDPGRVPLKPADGGTAINNVSIVLLGEVGRRRFLLAGDIEEQVDPELLARGLPQVDLLKVAHHGSRTSSTQAFLDAVRPRVAVVSAGLGNPYGHPAPATIDRLNVSAGQTFRTDRDGTVEVRIDDDAIRVRSTGSRRAATGGAIAPATTATDPSRSAFLFACAIPTPVGRPSALPIVAEAPSSEPGALGSAAGQAQLGATVWDRPRVLGQPAGRAETLLYHRTDDGPLAHGGGIVAPLPRPARLARAPFARCRRGGRVARGPDCWTWHPDRSTARRGCRAPPRRGQDPASDRPGAAPPARRGLGGLAGAP